MDDRVSTKFQEWCDRFPEVSDVNRLREAWRAAWREALARYPVAADAALWVQALPGHDDWVTAKRQQDRVNGYDIPLFTLAQLGAHVADERAALEWYAEHVAGCRKLGPDGDAARQALDKDGGERARAALASAPVAEPETMEEIHRRERERAPWVLPKDPTLPQSAPVAGEALTDDEIIDMAVEPLGIDCDRMPYGVVVFARNLLSRYAAPQASKPDFADAYEGAREDLAIWKRRALEAESDLRAERETSSRLVAELNGQNGPTHMGEPAPQASEAKNYPGDDVAERLDNMADDQPPGSQAQSDLYAAATIWRKHIAHRAAPQASEAVRNVEDAERWRWATAIDENAQTLHSIVLCHGGDQQKINARADFYRAALSAQSALISGAPSGRKPTAAERRAPMAERVYGAGVTAQPAQKEQATPSWLDGGADAVALAREDGLLPALPGAATGDAKP